MRDEIRPGEHPVCWAIRTGPRWDSEIMLTHQDLVALFAPYRFLFESEKDLQDSIERILKEKNIEYDRELTSQFVDGSDALPPLAPMLKCARMQLGFEQ